MRRREAPPHTIWVLICPDTGGYSYNISLMRIMDLSYLSDRL
ncbi:hypothetical protein [Pseudanabaena sp. CCNP1317]|nr:hypothetical protein [Pseudanabaena sp. CCNP1317]MEA5486468.1 hypothetical protein [Pseudanabaena sp. CCNP1317]